MRRRSAERAWSRTDRLVHRPTWHAPKSTPPSPNYPAERARADEAWPGALRRPQRLRTPTALAHPRASPELNTGVLQGLGGIRRQLAHRAVKAEDHRSAPTEAGEVVRAIQDGTQHVGHRAQPGRIRVVEAQACGGGFIRSGPAIVGEELDFGRCPRENLETMTPGQSSPRGRPAPRDRCRPHGTPPQPIGIRPQRIGENVFPSVVLRTDQRRIPATARSRGGDSARCAVDAGDHIVGFLWRGREACV